MHLNEQPPLRGQITGRAIIEALRSPKSRPRRRIKRSTILSLLILLATVGAGMLSIVVR